VTDASVGDRVLGTADYAGCATAGASDFAIMKYWTRVPADLDLVDAAALPMAVETGGKRNNPQAEGNIARLLSAGRKSDRPVLHVRHLSLTPGSVFAQDAHGSQIKAEVAPIGDEPVIFKNVNSAFIGTTREQQLHDRKITQLVIVGLTTDHCVSTTTRMAGNLGFEVYLVSDGTATFERIGPNGKHYSADEIHEVNLASLHGEFAEAVCTDGILANLTVVAAEV